MKAVIIEDEALIARELKSKLAEVAPDVTVEQVLPSVKTANRWLMENAEPDLIFADIQLSDGISFEIFERYNLQCPVVFTTAYDEYAMRAFKVNGIDYLLKPVDEEELKKAVDKCRDRAGRQQKLPQNLNELLDALQKQNMTTPLYKEKFVVHQRNTWLPVPTKTIACFVRDQLNYIYTFGSDKYIADFTTLEEIEDLLDPKQFYRANRHAIVNIDAIQSVRPHENQKLTLTLKAPLNMVQDVSREKAPSFKKWFEQ